MRRPIDTDRFASQLRGLDRATLGAFVAELWRARGHRVEAVEDPWVLTVGTGDGPGEAGARTVLVTTGRPWSRLTERTDRPVDAVVVPVVDPTPRWLPGPSDAEIIDAERLREYALFAIDHDAGRRLCEEYLHTEPFETIADPEPSDPDGLPEITGPDRSGALTTGAAVALLVIAAIGGPLLVGQFGGDDPGPRYDAVGAAPPTTETGGAAAPDRITATATNRSIGLISLNTIRDTRALSYRHVSLLTWPYRWRLTFTAYENGSVIANHTERISVEAPNEFLGNVTVRGREDVGAWMIDRGDIYADGRRYFLRRIMNGSVRYDSEPIDPSQQRSPLASRAYSYVSIFLLNATVVDIRTSNGTTLYVVRAGGNPIYDNIRNVSTEAVVSAAHGVIYLQTTYTDPSSDADRVRFTFRYAFGDFELAPPPWYEDAKNATVYD